MELEKKVAQLENVNKQLQRAYEFMLIQLGNETREQTRLKAVKTAVEALQGAELARIHPGSPCSVLESPFS
eukprot:scaffold515622_cov36-Prasinocladus_malaysianus.AAC.1